MKNTIQIDQHNQFIRKIAKKHFSATVLKINRITEGYSHFMYDVEINKKPFNVIMRFTNTKKPEYNLLKEKYVMDIMTKKQIPVAKIYAIDTSKKFICEEYMIMEKFKGQNLKSIWQGLTEADKIEITIKIGQLLKKIHSIKLARYGIIKNYGEIDADKSFEFRKSGKKQKYSASLRELFKMFMGDFSRLLPYKKLKPKFTAKIMTYITKNIEILEHQGKPTLIHGDFRTEHIFIEKIKEKYEIKGLIDFEFAHSLCPEYDFIKLHRQGFFDDKKLFSALQKGYGKFNHKAVPIHRLMRDLGFAQAVLESGDHKTAENVLKSIEKRINK